MLALLQFSLSLLAFNAFALAKFNHFKEVFNKRPSNLQSNWLLLVAWISILLSGLLCVYYLGAYGVLQFCGFMSLSVLITMIFYNFAARFVKCFSVITMMIVGITTLFWALNYA